MKIKLNVSLTKLIVDQFVTYWYYYLGAFLCLFFTHYIQSDLPFYAKELAEIVTSGVEKIDTSKFFLMALGIIIFRTSSRLLFFYPARVMQKNMRVELLAKLENAEPSRYAKYSSGQLFQILSNDMEQIRAMIGFALLQIGNIVVAMSVLVPKVVAFNSQIVVALIPLVVSFCLFTYIVSRNKVYYRKTQDLQGEVQNFIMESYAGKKTIKNYHSEKSFIDLFKSHSYSELWNFYKAGTRVSVAMPFVPLGVGISLLWGAYIIKMQDLGPSSLVLFSGFVFLFLEPLMFLSWIGVVFTRSHGAWARIRELVNIVDIPSEKEELIATIDSTEDTITLPYWDTFLNIPLNKGKWSVLVGRTGSGKTELIKNMALGLRKQNKNISYVAQDPYLYNDSVLNNIFLGNEATDEKKTQAKVLLELFGLDYLASSTDELFSMEVGENGKRLSGGQAKRLCLVRSLMGGADILLWDDPFSSVDLILEKQIFSKLKTMDFVKEKTIVLTSHRLSTVRLSDHVMYIDKDKGMVEQGPVAEIVNGQSKGAVVEYFENQMV